MGSGKIKFSKKIVTYLKLVGGFLVISAFIAVTSLNYWQVHSTSINGQNHVDLANPFFIWLFGVLAIMFTYAKTFKACVK